MAKFCSKCGKELEEGVKFCSACGNSLNDKRIEVEKPTKFIRSLPLFINAVIALISGIIGCIGYIHRWSGAAKNIMSISERVEVEIGEKILVTLGATSIILSVFLFVFGIIYMTLDSKKTVIEEIKKIKTMYLILTPVTVLACILGLYIMLSRTAYIIH